MAQLVVRNVPDHLVETLERRAAAAGISPEELHRQILREALDAQSEAPSFKEHLLAMPNVGEDWMFDRKDPRNQHPERPPFSFED
jgi:plasmid stability protein